MLLFADPGILRLFGQEDNGLYVFLHDLGQSHGMRGFGILVSVTEGCDLL